jgi:hypothetical protein
MELNERSIQVTSKTGITGTDSGALVKNGAIAGLIVVTQTTSTITFSVSVDGTNFYAITPPSGDFTGITSSGKAFPADVLAFLAPYPYVKITFGSSQSSGGASIYMPVMA